MHIGSLIKSTLLHSTPHYSIVLSTLLYSAPLYYILYRQFPYVNIPHQISEPHFNTGKMLHTNIALVAIQ